MLKLQFGIEIKLILCVQGEGSACLVTVCMYVRTNISCRFKQTNLLAVRLLLMIDIENREP